jgi:hypothetical protein
MSEWWQTVGALVIGGLLTVGGGMIAEFIKDRRHLKRMKKEALHSELFQLQSDLEEIFTNTGLWIDGRLGGFFEIGMENQSEFYGLTIRLSSQAVRIGDIDVSRYVGEVTKRLSDSRHAPDYKSAQDLWNEARGQLGLVEETIILLIHADTNTKNPVRDMSRSLSWPVQRWFPDLVARRVKAKYGLEDEPKK